MIWRQLDSMAPSDSSEKSRLYREQERVFEFVMRLRPEFEITRSQILNRETPCTLEEAVKAFVAKETRQRSLDLSSSLHSSNILAARHSPSPGTTHLSQMVVSSSGPSTAPASFPMKKKCHYC